jgi:hypothetical protein
VRCAGRTVLRHVVGIKFRRETDCIWRVGCVARDYAGRSSLGSFDVMREHDKEVKEEKGRTVRIEDVLMILSEGGEGIRT